jgi:hypothetical protein
MRASDVTRGAFGGTGPLLWLATAFWLMATVGSVAAGLGLLGAAPFHRRWRALAWTGVAGSIGLLAVFRPGAWALFGLVPDAVVVALLLRTRDGIPLAAHRRRRLLRGVGAAASVLFVAWLALVILARPWQLRWGSTAEELRRPLPGDAPGVRPSFQIQHAVVIPAQPDEVWPWLAQLGHDRGGFYSYSWLENGFGLHVRNADRIHPEWQRIAAGDSVLSTPDDYLGTGRRFGWRVAAAEQNRLLVLESWGAFVLEPSGDGTTKLIVRTRGAGRDGPGALVLAPLGLMVLEPAHFIMERRMLLGIRERVEAAQAAKGGAS